MFVPIFLLHRVNTRIGGLTVLMSGCVRSCSLGLSIIASIEWLLAYI